MIDNLLFTKTMALFEQGLNTASLRNKVIANNIANIDTPGFKRSEVFFEEELRKALSSKGKLTGYITHEKHIPLGATPPVQIEPKIVKINDTSFRNDGNNVDIDREMALLAKNTISFYALSQGISGEFQKIKSAIQGR